MRLYTTTGATQVDDPEFGTFTAGANGAFDGLPDAMYAKLHGRPGWENDPERELRITKEELDRFRDPAELLKAVKELGANQGVLAAAIASALGLVPAPTSPAESPASIQDAEVGPVDTPELATEASSDEGDSFAESTGEAEPGIPPAPIEASSPAQDSVPDVPPVAPKAVGPTLDVKPKSGRRGKTAPDPTQVG